MASPNINFSSSPSLCPLYPTNEPYWHILPKLAWICTFIPLGKSLKSKKAFLWTLPSQKQLCVVFRMHLQTCFPINCRCHSVYWQLRTHCNHLRFCCWSQPVCTVYHQCVPVTRVHPSPVCARHQRRIPIMTEVMSMRPATVHCRIPLSFGTPPLLRLLSLSTPPTT